MHLPITHPLLLVPVQAGAPKGVIQLWLDDEMVREVGVELARDGEPGWWATYDLSPWLGQTLEVRADEGVAEALRLGDEAPDRGDLYRESLRPQLHFTPQRGWNNDPNGLVHLDGEWHLYFQHNPFGTGWGNMHWGHAVSRDLVHWEELPLALYPRGLKDMAYSGGGVVDHANTAGFRQADEDVLVVSFTSTGRGECLAHSHDRGRTFVDYAGNPVITHRGRDPKILWYEPQQKWVLVLYDETDDRRRYAFYESKDLKDWRYLSAVEGLYENPNDGLYECPEFFELPLDGDPARMKWVLHGAVWRTVDGERQVSRSSYLVGTFDGTTFTPETPPLNGHLGPHFYAAQTFSGAPDGRRIMLGWLAGAHYRGMPFSQGFTVPLELSLRSTPDGPRLAFEPVAELASLRAASSVAGNLRLANVAILLASVTPELFDLTLEFESDGDVTLGLHGVPLVYCAADSTLTFAGVTAAVPRGRVLVRALIDRAVIEVFAAGGRVAMSAGGDALGQTDLTLSLSGPEEARVTRLEAHILRSIWE